MADVFENPKEEGIEELADNDLNRLNELSAEGPKHYPQQTLIALNVIDGYPYLLMGFMVQGVLHQFYFDTKDSIVINNIRKGFDGFEAHLNSWLEERAKDAN